MKKPRLLLTLIFSFVVIGFIAGNIIYCRWCQEYKPTKVNLYSEAKQDSLFADSLFKAEKP